MARPVARRIGTDAAVLPEWIRPQLTELVDVAPEGAAWLHEIKFDGYRMACAPRSRRCAAVDPHPGAIGRTNIRRSPRP
jgi:hypothetical protein